MKKRSATLLPAIRNISAVTTARAMLHGNRNRNTQDDQHRLLQPGPVHLIAHIRDLDKPLGHRRIPADPVADPQWQLRERPPAAAERYW